MSDWMILISDPIDPLGIEILQQKAKVQYKPDMNAQELHVQVRFADALIVRGRSKVTSQVIQSGKRLKVIGRAGVGVDNIDLQAAKARGVIVVNSPKASSSAVAELTIGLLFSLARCIPYADKTMKNGEWKKKELQGIELRGKTLGIIGLGNIGQQVAQLASALGMKVLGYDRYLSPEDIEQRHAAAASLTEICERADFLSVHLPLNAETHGMFSRKLFAKMKAGTYLVSTARGGIIDEHALLEALAEGIIAGAALDVFEIEPPGKSSLVAHPAVIATPHIGAQTLEAQKRAAEQIAQEVLAALEGAPLRWRVI